MKVFIPSFRRAAKLRRKTSTLGLWPKDFPVSLVVQHQEYKQYEQELAAAELPKVELLVLPKEMNNCGLVRTRNFILDATPDAEVCVMLDDDLRFSVRDREDNPLYLRACTPKEVVDALRLLEKWCKHDVAQASISMREGNHRHAALTKENSRCCRAIAYNTAVLNKEGFRFRPDIGEKDEFDMTLRLLRKGYRNRISYKYAQNQPGSGVSGGCSGTRDFERMRSTCMALKAAHPDLVNVRLRKTKGAWGVAGLRYEVQMNWAKAYQYDARFRVPSLV